MEFLLTKIKENLNEQMLLLTISNPRKAEEVKKYNIRPILVKDKLVFQSAAYTKTQVFHKNLSKRELLEEVEKILPLYKQVQLQTSGAELTALINKKGKAAIKVKKQNNPAVAKLSSDKSHLLHNRTKKYILPEGVAVPFLKDLGVMTAEGKIVRTKYDKYRQINRFLEFIEDVLPHLPKDREITILDFGCGKSYLTFAMYYYLKELKGYDIRDFGCGKSYLTFAMYYYLKELKGYDIRIIGLDLKKDVIKNCSRLAVKYGYDKLNFYEGSIEEFEGVTQVDMVVTLHACDTATDYALYKALRWGASVILSVPCCQHELNKQISASEFEPITDYGILKERFCALATDGIRAKILEEQGYDTQILEFIDMEHTPKNLLIRALHRKKPSAKKREKASKEVNAFCEQFGFAPTLWKLLQEEGGVNNE